MARSKPVHRLLLAAHNFAERHVAANGSPNPDAFDVEWDAFCERNPKLLDTDLRIICSYAMAALYYSPRKRYWVRNEGKGTEPSFISIEHEAVPGLPRGLWAGRQGNIMGDGDKREAA